MIEIYYKNLKDKKLNKLPEFKAGSWVFVENPDEDELEYLIGKLSLQRGLLNDSLDQNEVPRMEIDNKVTYIYTRIPIQEGDDVSTTPFLIAMGKDFLLTMSKKKMSLLDGFTNDRISFYTTQKTKLFIQIFSAVNSQYGMFLTGINRKVRAIKKRLSKIHNKDIVQFVHFEEDLNEFLASLVPTNTILKKLLSGKYLKLFEEDKDLVEDLMLSNGQLVETSKSTLKNITNIRDAYSTLMTHDLNRVIKLLTALTIILTIPTIIASIYGMNVSLPLQNSPIAFAVIVSVTVVIVAILLIVFNKNKWL